MTTNPTFLCLRRFSIAGAVVAALIVPASANKDPVKPEQLKAYQEAFMEEVKKGDLLFHGDAATAQKLGVTLSTTGWACAMCHPMASDTHPHAFPKFQVSGGQVRNAARHDQLVHREAQPGREDRVRTRRP